MYKNIIMKICNELGIEVKILSNGWIMMLKYNGITKYIAGYKFDLNSHGAGMVVDDKYAMYDVLRECSIPVLKHKIVYSNLNKEEYAKDLQGINRIKEIFNDYDENVVVKINNGTCGKGVYHITDINKLYRVINDLFISNHSISICPFCEIEEEVRVIIFKGEVKIIYSKVRPIVVGDGRKKISELLKEFNKEYNYYLLEDKILEDGQKYVYSWKHNLSTGAKIKMDIDNRDVVSDLAIRAANVLGLDFGSVDIIKVNNNYMVLECNSGVMMDNLIKILPDGKDVAYNIYKDAIKGLFLIK